MVPGPSGALVAVPGRKIQHPGGLQGGIQPRQSGALQGKEIQQHLHTRTGKKIRIVKFLAAGFIVYDPKIVSVGAVPEIRPIHKAAETAPAQLPLHRQGAEGPACRRWRPRSPRA